MEAQVRTLNSKKPISPECASINYNLDGLCLGESEDKKRMMPCQRNQYSRCQDCAYSGELSGERNNHQTNPLVEFFRFFRFYFK